MFDKVHYREKKFALKKTNQLQYTRKDDNITDTIFDGTLECNILAAKNYACQSIVKCIISK